MGTGITPTGGHGGGHWTCLPRNTSGVLEEILGWGSALGLFSGGRTKEACLSPVGTSGGCRSLSHNHPSFRAWRSPAFRTPCASLFPSLSSSINTMTICEHHCEADTHWRPQVECLMISTLGEAWILHKAPNKNMITKYDKRQGGGKTTKRGNFK